MVFSPLFFVPFVRFFKIVSEFDLSELKEEATSKTTQTRNSDVTVNIVKGALAKFSREW